MQDQFSGAGVQVLGISVDTWPSANHFAEHLGLKFPLLSDFPKFQTGKDYGVFNDERSVHTRTTFVLDRDGVVRTRIEGVDPSEHARLSWDAAESLRTASR